MTIKEKIRQKASQIFDVLIPENQWSRYFELLDRDGHPNRREMLQLFISICQSIEKLETHIEDLYFKVELLEGVRKKDDVQTTQEDFKLRTPMDVASDLDKEWHPNTTAFYVTEADWKILEKTVDPVLAKTDPARGYSREVDPKDGKEKVCLLYKELPVFKKKE